MPVACSDGVKRALTDRRAPDGARAEARRRAGAPVRGCGPRAPAMRFASCAGATGSIARQRSNVDVERDLVDVDAGRVAGSRFRVQFKFKFRFWLHMKCSCPIHDCFGLRLCGNLRDGLNVGDRFRCHPVLARASDSGSCGGGDGGSGQAGRRLQPRPLRIRMSTGARCLRISIQMSSPPRAATTLKVWPGAKAADARSCCTAPISSSD